MKSELHVTDVRAVLEVTRCGLRREIGEDAKLIRKYNLNGLNICAEWAMVGWLKGYGSQSGKSQKKAEEDVGWTT